MFIYLIFIYTFYNSFKNNGDISNEKFIMFLLNNGNSNFTDDYKFNDFVNKTMTYFLNIDLTEPYSLFIQRIYKSTKRFER